jgi:hypothetical protein
MRGEEQSQIASDEGFAPSCARSKGEEEEEEEEEPFRVSQRGLS